MSWDDMADYPAPHFDNEDAASAWWDGQGLSWDEDDNGDGHLDDPADDPRNPPGEDEPHYEEGDDDAHTDRG